MICVPLRNRGKTLGAIELVNRIEHDAFTDLDMKALQNIAQYAAIAINNAHLYKKRTGWLLLTTIPVCPTYVVSTKPSKGTRFGKE